MIITKQLIFNGCCMFIPFFASVLGCYLYPKVAIKFGAIAIPNSRSLHIQPIPRGAGIIIAMCVLTSLLIINTLKIIYIPYFMPIMLAAIVMSIVGFLDDCLELSASLRLCIQIIIAIWLYYWLVDNNTINFGFVSMQIGLLKIPFTILFLVWYYNLFNFMDGSDGMASSAVIYIASVFLIIAYLEHQKIPLVFLTILSSATLGFLLFNWPPAKMFLGDVGTNFCSCIISVIMLITIWHYNINLFVWLIALGYYLLDTTITLLIRMVKFPRAWFKAHRSHAYQNLVLNIGHLPALLIIWAINLLWFLPFAMLAYYFPQHSIWYFVISYAVGSLFIVKYGPLYKGLK